MGLRAKTGHRESSLIVNATDYFSAVVGEAFERRKLRIPPLAGRYLVNLLEYYLDARNLFFTSGEKEDSPRREKTLAELYLEAGQSAHPKKQELLKTLADRSLYISGFFGDSLQRSLVDLDYYAEMGGSAYGWLADSAAEANVAEVYRLYSRRFTDLVDVLSYISQKSMAKTDQNLLRLYESYLRTGSEMARQQLAEHGVFPLRHDALKGSKQD